MMEAKIISKSDDHLKICWEKTNVGFGEINMVWDDHTNAFKLDSEFMGIDFVLEVFKALK